MKKIYFILLTLIFVNVFFGVSAYASDVIETTDISYESNSSAEYLVEPAIGCMHISFIDGRYTYLMMDNKQHQHFPNGTKTCTVDEWEIECCLKCYATVRTTFIGTSNDCVN